MKKISEAVQYLDYAANHFAHSDWNYTRDHKIDSIRYVKNSSPTGYRDSLKARIKVAFSWLFSSKKRGFIYDNSIPMRIRYFFYALEKERNLPDGHLDGGNVITFWEETGEYLQMVQPSVGALLATFLKEDPKNPHAKLIIKELERIQAGYRKRLKKDREKGE